MSSKFLKVITMMMIYFCAVSCANKTDEQAENQNKNSDIPNVVLVIVDDLGWGDIGVSSNPVVQTSELNQLAGEAVTLTDFHTDPRCSPTRAALMTGMNSLETGVLHTVQGRNILPTQFPTLAEVFKDNGYATGLFGKWHLGDNYPFRPRDRGFDRVVRMGGGGPSQAWDYWGNDMWGDTYLTDGKWTPYAGYTNDVWFDEAESFVREKAQADKPFFAYIATGNVHSPWRAPHETLEPYIEMGLPPILARFYAMIEEVDTRIGTLRKTLEEEGVADNTIFIFMADNGSPLDYWRVISGSQFESVDEFVSSRPEWSNWNYNAGLRDVKSSMYDGGHRVPFFISWPKRLGGDARSIDALTSHIDLFPTLVDWLGLDIPEKMNLRGESLVELLQGDTSSMPDRSLFISGQQSRYPDKNRPAVVLTEKWRYLTDVGELYDVDVDRGQKRNIADENVDVVGSMQAEYSKWWQDVVPSIPEMSRPIIGTSHEPNMRLTIIDAALPENPNPGTILPWNPGFSVDQYGGIPSGWIGNEASVPVRDFLVHAAVDGRYKFRLYFHDRQAARVIPFSNAHFKINGEHFSISLEQASVWADFEVDLKEGPVDFTGWFSNSKNVASSAEDAPAFYIYVQHMGK